MGRCHSIFGEFGETARCRDAQHRDRVCCAFAPQLVIIIMFIIIIISILTGLNTLSVLTDVIINGMLYSEAVLQSTILRHRRFKTYVHFKYAKIERPPSNASTLYKC